MESKRGARRYHVVANFFRGMIQHNMLITSPVDIGLEGVLKRAWRTRRESRDFKGAPPRGTWRGEGGGVAPSHQEDERQHDHRKDVLLLG